MVDNAQKPKKVSSTAKVKARSKRQVELKSFGHKPQHDYGLAISRQQLALIGRAAGYSVRGTERLHADLETAFAQFAADRQAGIRSITPHELRKDLEAIEKEALRLATMLSELREAEDAMVRAVRPQYDVPTLVPEPLAPPYFSFIAIEIAQAAAAARKSTSPKPYVRAERGQLALNKLIKALLGAWENAFERAPTFGHTPRPSPFIRFVCACFRHIGIRVGELEALAKKCRRIQTALKAARR